MCHMPHLHDPALVAARATADLLIPDSPLAERDLVAMAVAEQWRHNGGTAGVFLPGAVYWVAAGDPPVVEADATAAEELTELLANSLAPADLVPNVLLWLTARRYAYFANERGRLLVIRASPHRRRFLVDAADENE